jgi:DNA-binding phage protein
MSPAARKLIAEVAAAIERTGWSETSRRSGVDRVSLHRAFGAKTTVPSFTTLDRVAQALGLSFTVTEPSA